MFNKLPVEMIYRGLVLAGLVGTMYLQSHYVPRAEFTASQEAMWHKLSDIGANVTALGTKMEVRESDRDLLHDHENRIRDLERAQRKP